MFSRTPNTFGPDILMRTASWLTFKEPRASFLIEREADKADRIQRFAHVIAKYYGHNRGSVEH